MNTDKPKSYQNECVSIIIPVYNGEDYIEQTIKCVMNQSYDNIEIIIVDDGSTDNTSHIIKMLSNQDSRIHYFHREKHNAGVQRNYGLEQSVGQYVMFLDSDDLFEKDLIEKMLQQITVDDADMCICNVDQYNTETGEYIPKSQYLRISCIPEIIPFSRREIGKDILHFTSLVPWNKMFRRGFIDEHQLCFQDIQRANDQYFSILALVLAERITVVNKILVHYRVKQKGNLTTEFSDTPLCSYEAMVKAKDALEDIGLMNEEDVRCSFDNKALNIMIFSLNIQNTTNGYKTLYDTLTQGGFERLGLILRDKEYYNDPLEYENFKKILDMTYDEYLLAKNREYRETIARKNELVKEKNSQIRSLKKIEREYEAVKKRKWYRAVNKVLPIYSAMIKPFKKTKPEGKTGQDED